MTQARPPVILNLGPFNFAVAVWVRDEGTVPLYEIRHRDIREASVAATVARQAEEQERRHNDRGARPFQETP